MARAGVGRNVAIQKALMAYPIDEIADRADLV
jgi:hypothetical protein